MYSFIDGVLFNKTKTILYAYFGIKGSSSYVIPDSVTTIGDWAFCRADDHHLLHFTHCERLTEVTIPDSVTSIDDDAFDQSVIIIAQEGSAAHNYAMRNDVTFKVASEGV